MTDLGFGLVDRRSVIVVLFVLGVSHLFLGNQIPIDTSDAVTAFLSLIVLTGFIYAFRSLLRIGITLCYAVIRLPFDIYQGFKEKDSRQRGLRGFIIVTLSAIKNSFMMGFVVPLFFIRDWKFRYRMRGYSRTELMFGFLGIIDRLLLVVIAYAATDIKYLNQVQVFGLIGVALMIFIYIISGSFSFVINDAMRQAELEQEKQHEEMVAAASNPNISFPKTIYTKSEPQWTGP